MPIVLTSKPIANGEWSEMGHGSNGTAGENIAGVNIILKLSKITSNGY